MTNPFEGYAGPSAAARGCVDPDVLMALAGDALPEDVRRAAEAHVAACAACRALAADLHAIEPEVPGSLDQRVLAQRSAQHWWRTVLPLAAVLVVAVGAGVWWRAQREPPGQSASVNITDPAPVAPRVAGTWNVEKPALLLPMATALVVRGDEDKANRDLAAALAPYRQNDFAAAGTALQRVVADYPTMGEAWFYLGASRLLGGDPAGARVALAEARTRGVADRDDELAWLLATAEARSGHHAEARARLESLCQGGGDFRRPACAALPELE